MEIDNTAQAWDTEDVVAFRNFLKTRAGVRLLPKLLESTPLLLPRGKKSEILIRSGEVRGCQLLANNLLAMAYPPAEEEPEKDNQYPSLTDDKAWGDGHKIETPQ